MSKTYRILRNGSEIFITAQGIKYSELARGVIPSRTVDAGLLFHALTDLGPLDAKGVKQVVKVTAVYLDRKCAVEVAPIVAEALPEIPVTEMDVPNGAWFEI